MHVRRLENPTLLTASQLGHQLPRPVRFTPGLCPAPLSRRASQSIIERLRFLRRRFASCTGRLHFGGRAWERLPARARSSCKPSGPPRSLK